MRLFIICRLRALSRTKRVFVLNVETLTTERSLTKLGFEIRVGYKRTLRKPATWPHMSSGLIFVCLHRSLLWLLWLVLEDGFALYCPFCVCHWCPSMALVWSGRKIHHPLPCHSPRPRLICDFGGGHLRGFGGSMIERCRDRQRECGGLKKRPLHPPSPHLWTAPTRVVQHLSHTPLITLAGLGVASYLGIVVAGTLSYACPFWRRTVPIAHSERAAPWTHRERKRNIRPLFCHE